MRYRKLGKTGLGKHRKIVSNKVICSEMHPRDFHGVLATILDTK